MWHKMGQGPGQVVDDTASGDLKASIAVDYITVEKMEKGANIGYFYPKEMLVIPSPAAIFKGTPNLKAARRFIDFLLTKQQEIIATHRTLPVRMFHLKRVQPGCRRRGGKEGHEDRLSQDAQREGIHHPEIHHHHAGKSPHEKSPSFPLSQGRGEGDLFRVNRLFFCFISLDEAMRCAFCAM